MTAKQLDMNCENKMELETSANDNKNMASGLCVNCRHRMDCVHLAGACSPVTACELHECETDTKSRVKMLRLKPVIRTDAGTQQDEHIGLCANCDNRNICRLPKAPGGVWHCEEYC